MIERMTREAFRFLNQPGGKLVYDKAYGLAFLVGSQEWDAYYRVCRPEESEDDVGKWSHTVSLSFEGCPLIWVPVDSYFRVVVTVIN